MKLDFKTKDDIVKCCLESVKYFKKLSANVTIEYNRFINDHWIFNNPKMLEENFYKMMADKKKNILMEHKGTNLLTKFFR